MKTLLKALLITFLLIGSSSVPTFGQDSDDPLPIPAFPKKALRFQHLTTEDGLSEGRVWGITQDRRGFMWFTTWDGINRYDGYEFKVYKEELGNPNSPGGEGFWDIYEDREGMIWAASHTGGGLSRFDPTTEQWRRYQHDPDDPDSLSSNGVYAIFEDSMGALWIGTEGGGLNRFEGETQDGQARFTRFGNNPDDPNNLGSAVVVSIYEDRSGMLWVGTYGGGLLRFDRETETFTYYQHNPDDPESLSYDLVYLIYEDQYGVLWVGTYGGGLNRFDRETETFTHYRHDPNDPHSLSGETITGILEDESGTLWIGTWDGGLNRYDRNTDTLISYQHESSDTRSLGNNTVTTLFEDQSGTLWVGTAGGGIDRLDPFEQAFGLTQHRPTDSNSLSNEDIRAVLEDRSGDLWMGTWSGGLNHYDPETEMFTHYLHDPDDPGSLGDNHVLSLFEDRQGVLWIGLDNGGFNRLDRGSENGDSTRFTRFEHDPADPQSLSNNSVTAIYEDSADILWVGTWAGGLNAFNRQTEDGHARFKRYQHDPEDPHSLGKGIVWAIHEDPAGVLWVGTAGGGLCRFDRDSETFACHVHDPDDDHSLSSDTVWAIHQDGDGSLWLGTSTGLNQFSFQTGQFTHYTTADGLPHDTVVGILEDDASPGDRRGDLWLSTLGGLSRFDPQSGTFHNYDASDGLQGDIFNPAAFKTSEGIMLFGGQQGLTTFYPEDVRENPNIPLVHVTGLALSNEPISIGGDSPLQKSIFETERIELSHDERVISFEFAALNYSSPEKNRYRYKLEGFDEQWIEVGSDRRHVTYTNLDPGQYTFKVLGSNNDGVWNEQGASIQLTITPPWWETWWFRGGMLLLVVGLVAGSFVWQRDGARRRERQLKNQVAERTHELGERVKKLDCLYGISRLAVQQGLSLEQILNGVVALLPPAWQYPEITCVRISLIRQEFETEGFRETPWRQSSAIVVQGEQAGQVQVAYLEERPDADEGPFLKGERALLTAVAERLGNILEGKQSQVALLENEQKFRALFHGMPVPVYTWQRSGQDIVLVDANFEAESITGGTIGDFLGTTLSAMYSDRPDIVQDISHTFAGKVSFQREMAYSFKSTGEDKTLLVKYTYVPPDLVMVQTEDVTQQRRAEQALQESKSRLDLSIAGSQGGLWHIRLDPEAPSDTLPDEIYLSPRMKSFLGFQDDEFPNSMPAWGNQILPEDLPKLRENSLKFRTGEIDHYGFEYRIRHKDGSIRWLQTSGQLEYDRDGRVILFAGIDWDITARKQVELQIRFQANLLDAVEQAVVVTNPEGEVIYWNPFAEKLYGWPAEEVISGKTNEFIVDNCGQLKNIQIAETLKAGNSWAGEYIARCRDGTLLTVQSTISVISDQSGIYYIGVAHDISDRKQAEIALKASEEKYRDLVEKVSDVIYSVDAEGILTYASPAIESLLGISPEEAIGQPVAGFMLPDDLDRINQNFQKLMSGMVLSLNEYRMVTASSETRWVRISSQPINVDGRVTGLQGVLTDITERKILEEQLEVEATSAERERLARGLHDTVTQSLYSINLQSDAIKMALSSGENDKAERRLQILKEIAQEAMNEMRLLIYQMHPSILQKAGLAAALRQRLDAVEVRSGLVTDFQVESERRLPLEIESILFQIAQEGLNNVLKHAKANEIQVRISYKPDGCRLTIQDDGVGFDAESIHRYGGYGLENMRDQLEKINGWLSIDSQPGKGTTLEIEVIL